MKTLITVVSSWACATGAAVVASYCIMTHCQNTSKDQKRASEVAARISSRGTISEYKPKTRHSSVMKKTTTAKVTQVSASKCCCKCSPDVPNPIHPPFTNALAKLTEEIAGIATAKGGEVSLGNGYALVAKDGKPTLTIPEQYAKVVIGGVAMGEVLKRWYAPTQVKKVGCPDQWVVEEVGLSWCRRLDEPEFYCTSVSYSALPATKQVDVIRMHGYLQLGNTSKAQEVVGEIAKWMKESYGAVDQGVAAPAGTLALKKLKIGNGMEVEVKLNWYRRQNDARADAVVDIAFTLGELVGKDKSQRQELGQAVNTARIITRGNTGVNYFTLRPMVPADAVKSRLVE